MGRDNDMQGKVIAVTGGASGMGLATAQILHARGASLALCDINQSALDAALDAFGKDRVLCSRINVADRVAVDEWIKAVVERFGRLDGAANCAGVIGVHHGTRDVKELEDEQWNLIMGVNLTGVMYCMRAQLRVIQSPGSIVCISSVMGVEGGGRHAAYAASKHGVLGLVRSAAKEEGARNVRVNAVCPGLIDTPLLHQRNAIPGVRSDDYPVTPIPRMGSPSEVAQLIAWLLSEEASFVTGATYLVDAGWTC